MSTKKESFYAGVVITIVLLLVAGYVMFIVSGDAVVEESSAVRSLESNEDFSEYTDINGKLFDLTMYAGEVLIVNSWASWSPSSAHELTLLIDTANEYKDQGIQVVAINRAETDYVAKSFLNHIGISDHSILILDPDDRYYKSIGGYAMPETVFYDTEGNVIHHARGAMQKEEIDEQIKRILSIDVSD